MITHAQLEDQDLAQLQNDTCDILAKTKVGTDSANNDVYSWTVETDDAPCRVETIGTEERERFQFGPTQLRDAEFRMYLGPTITIDEKNLVVLDSVRYNVIYVMPQDDLTDLFEIEVFLGRSK